MGWAIKEKWYSASIVYKYEWGKKAWQCSQCNNYNNCDDENDDVDENDIIKHDPVG